jgi:type IV pilus assembly protein PilO
MLSKLSGQNIALIIIAVSVLLAVAWYFTLYSNTLTEADGVRTEIVGLNEKKQVGERARTNVISLCQVVTDLERQKAEFLRALPSNEQFSSLLNTLRVQAGAGGGRLNSVSRTAGSAASPNTPPGVKSITVNMNLEATFDGIRTLLASFEQQQRFLKVETVSLSPGSTSPDPTAQLSNPLLTSTMSMTAYIYDNPNRGAAATPINPVCQSTPATEVPK